MSTPEEFTRFARQVTSGIDDRQERQDAAEEIVAHLLDIYADAIATGESGPDAVISALARMGDASAIARPIERAHTPRWSVGVVLAAIGGAAVVFGAIWLTFWLAM